jgi:hypothetical protein
MTSLDRLQLLDRLINRLKSNVSRPMDYDWVTKYFWRVAVGNYNKKKKLKIILKYFMLYSTLLYYIKIKWYN